MVPKGKRRALIVLLMIMTPGIPEYLGGSSKFSDLIFNTPSFFLGLVFNIGMYTCGALLIREFALRYKKGWASILTIGMAYGIIEEGISDHTFFIPAGGPVGRLAIYGRYMGVDWTWALGISLFHAVFSIGLPILILAIAFPKYANEPLLGKRSGSLVFIIYALDVIILSIAATHERALAIPTLAEYTFFFALASALVGIAKVLPSKLLRGRGRPEYGAKRLYLLGLLVFPLYVSNTLLSSTSTGSPRIAPYLDAILYVVANIVILAAIVKNLPERDNRKHKFALALGLITPLFVWAETIQIFGVNIIISTVTVIAIIFLLKLRKLVNS